MCVGVCVTILKTSQLLHVPGRWLFGTTARPVAHLWAGSLSPTGACSRGGTVREKPQKLAASAAVVAAAAADGDVLQLELELLGCLQAARGRLRRLTCKTPPPHSFEGIGHRKVGKKV